jgi:TonB family protein
MGKAAPVFADNHSAAHLEVQRVGVTGKSKWKLRRACVRFLPAAALAFVAGLALAGAAPEQRMVKTRIPPVYPEIARRLRVTGVVKLEVTVAADGKVSDVKTISGNHTLSVAAEEAVRKWKFASGSSESTEAVAINFELSQ